MFVSPPSISVWWFNPLPSSSLTRTNKLAAIAKPPSSSSSPPPHHPRSGPFGRSMRNCAVAASFWGGIDCVLQSYLIPINRSLRVWDRIWRWRLRRFSDRNLPTASNFKILIPGTSSPVARPIPYRIYPQSSPCSCLRRFACVHLLNDSLTSIYMYIYICLR